jgi:hypothetical protein
MLGERKTSRERELRSGLQDELEGKAVQHQNDVCDTARVDEIKTSGERSEQEQSSTAIKVV